MFHVSRKMMDSTGTSFPGQLNIFQRAMLQWNDLCPYNATHVVRIPFLFDRKKLESAIDRVLAAHGLGELVLNANRKAFRFQSSANSCELRQAAGDDSFDSLTSEIVSQLNSPFPIGEKLLPFRFFFAEGINSFSLGLTYFHPIADAESVVMLMKDIVTAYISNKVPGESERFDLYPPRRDRLRNGGASLLARKFAALPNIKRTLMTSDRFACNDPENFAIGFSFFCLGLEQLRKLNATAKTWNVTINDLFLAMLLRCVSPFAAARVNNRKRRNVSIGCIVNLRRDIELARPRTFGLFLGSFAVTHEVPPDASLEAIARDVRIQTRRIKEEKLCLGMPIQMSISRFFLSRFSTKFRQRFYAKQYPLYGGITNMNLNSLWREPLCGQPVNYFRAVSTGPITPLVFSITTAGEIVNIGLSYRTSVFAKKEALQIQNDFVRQITELSGSTN